MAPSAGVTTYSKGFSGHKLDAAQSSQQERQGYTPHTNGPNMATHEKQCHTHRPPRRVWCQSSDQRYPHNVTHHAHRYRHIK